MEISTSLKSVKFEDLEQLRHESQKKFAIKTKVLLIQKECTAKNGKPYQVIVLGQDNSRIDAIAHGKRSCQLLSGVLQEGQSVVFPSGIFSIKERDMTFAHKSASTCSNDLWFKHIDKLPLIFLADEEPVKQIPRLEKAIELTAQGNFPFCLQIDKAQIIGGMVYFYMGCKLCGTKARNFSNSEPFVCASALCTDGEKRKRLRSASTSVTVLMMIVGASIRDDEGRCLEEVVIYNNDSADLVGKTADQFSSPEEVEAFLVSQESNFYSLTLQKHNRKEGSTFTPTVFASDIKLRVKSAAIQKSQTDVKRLERGLDYEEIKAIVKYEQAIQDADLPKFHAYPMKLGTTICPELVTHRKENNVAITLRSRPRGMVLLINNYNYPDKSKVRKGSKKDVKKILEAFTLLEFKVYSDNAIEDVANPATFKEVIDKYKQALIESDADCSIVIVMGHGSNFELELVGQEKNQNSVNFIQDILIPFSQKEFPLFEAKPRIFIGAYCQRFDMSDYSRELKIWDNSLYNMFICFPAHPGFPSFRSEANGTVFVHYFVKHLLRHANFADFKEIIEMTKREIFKETKSLERNPFLSLPYWYVSGTFPQLYLTEEAAIFNENPIDLQKFKLS